MGPLRGLGVPGSTARRIREGGAILAPCMPGEIRHGASGALADALAATHGKFDAL